MTDAHSLRRTFDSVAEAYDSARPSYPETLFDDLTELARLDASSRVLEVGCATGKATLPLLERGLTVVCVEIGERLAAQARRKLAGLPVEVHVSPFEAWRPNPWIAFDLVCAATAWRWLDPGVRYQKAHSLLRPGGYLAFWNAEHAFPQGYDPFFAEIQTVYDEIRESYPGEWPPPAPVDVPDEAAEIEATGLFTGTHVRRYVWEITYTAESYIALLNTFSGHISMDPVKRDILYREIRRLIAGRRDDRIRRHWVAILHVARRV